ncbi:sortase [Solirubrobacter ginsenosidimutans]|uniref:Sortase n=1 Tax=Solirubrobacter ginsenosidimutans TaxID=490573 RepID=A0A9X3MWG0_9ACTN|nr:sortase [Solirubrobacter ginsenosidimutans]MDA0163989.1 sortase [Solirubrobacter ginsenosidimutans]
MVRRLTLFFALFLITGGVARAAEPPNQNDPCAKAGRDTCGTTGQGSYRTYRYGPRWFGDYRGAIDGVTGGTFCIDLRFWYPSKTFGYEQRSAAGLKNKAGKAVSASNLRKMNRALWRYGRSNDATQQAAVMIYVHQLMGDGAPGEADPKALSAPSQAIYAKVVSDAERFAGPYKVKATLPDKLVAGQEAQLTVEVLTSSGRRVPNVDVDLKATGASGVPDSVSTGDGGVAKATITGTDPGNGIDLDATAASLPDVTPALFAPTKGQSARNAQRLVQAAIAKPAVKLQAPVRAQPKLATQISAQTAAPGASITDTVNVSGLGGQSATVQAALYGPYSARDQIKCTDAPIWTGTIAVAADGDYVTAPVKLDTAGYYTYREAIAESDTIAGVETACAEASETTIIRGVPTVTTQVSAQETAPGAQISDSAVVSGLGKLSATVNVELWGPFPTRDAIKCEGTPFWTGSFPANGDGTYTTAPVALTAAGYYTYREGIAGTEAYDAITTACGEASETTLAKAAPQVTTKVSDTAVRPDGQISDTLVVTGLGKTPATVEVALYGPYASRADIDCAGAPYWKGTVNVTGDGTYTTEKATVQRVGFYVFREKIAATETIAAHEADCQVEAETSLGAPAILGGRGDTVAYVSQGSGGPSRVKLARLGIDAQVSAIGIDMKSGALGIPDNIKRVGWWRDGATPGDDAGTALLAGHVDSAKAGAGAFYALKSARRGDTVTVTQGAKTLKYRVTTIKIMRKAALPTDIYTRAGSPKLVLVTCGGPFDAKTGHYRDNVVVTAVPA